MGVLVWYTVFTVNNRLFVFDFYVHVHLCTPVVSVETRVSWQQTYYWTAAIRPQETASVLQQAINTESITTPRGPWGREGERHHPKGQRLGTNHRGGRGGCEGCHTPNGVESWSYLSPPPPTHTHTPVIHWRVFQWVSMCEWQLHKHNPDCGCYFILSTVRTSLLARLFCYRPVTPTHVLNAEI